MERSRRQRLTEIYGEPVGHPGTPMSLRERLIKQQLQDQQEEALRSQETLDSSLKQEKQPSEQQKEQPARQPKRVFPSSSQLIPSEVLDVSSQKLFLVALFMIIQGYKLYDLLLLKNNLPISSSLGIKSQSFNFLSKYLFYESGFLYFLPALRIPSLTFRKPIVILQIIAIFVFNVFLASELSFPLVTLLMAAWKKINEKDLTVLGSTTANVKYEPSKHFKGSHTIKILPENTANLNPFHESFCLPTNSVNYEVHVPIRFNSTSEIDFLQIKHLDLDTNVATLLNYTKKEIKKFNTKNLNDLYLRDDVSGPNIHYLNLPVSKTGVYQINQVLDSKFLGLRNYYSTLVVSNCPTAEINHINELPKNKCVGDLDSIKFTIEGVPPLKLKYKKFVNRDVQQFDDQSLQPAYFKSPLLNQVPSKQFSKEQLKDLSWAKPHTVEVELENPIKEVGDYSYKIEAIVDGLGNIMNFVDNFEGKDEMLRKFDLLHSFNVHDLPKLHLAEKANMNAATKKSLYLAFDQNVQDAAPFEAEIKFVNEDESQTETIKHVFNSADEEYPVNKAGTYTLLSAKSKYCSTIITGRSSISLSIPVVPQLAVHSRPITDSCVGQVGLTFDLAFTGSPPFTFQQKVYRVVNDQKYQQESKTMHSQGTRYRFTYEPTTEGHYEIVFTSLKDSLYLNPIELTPASEYTHTTSMRVKPNAEIHNIHSNKALCLGSKGKVPVQFRGEAPFKLQYDLIETLTNKRHSYTLEDIKQNKLEIITPEFKQGGEYLVSLTNVQDQSGCSVSLNGADANIKVRRDVPSVEFGTNNGVTKATIKQGEIVELPIRILGEGQFHIEYEYLDQDKTVISKHQKHFVNSHKTTIDVAKAGFYRLVSVRDSSCSGIVTNVDLFEVDYHNKPSLSLAEQSNVAKIQENVFEKPGVCQYHEDSIELQLHGSPPFMIEYSVVYPNGEKKSDTVSVATKFASIRLLNGKGGQYKYLITGIYDALYSKADLAKINHRIEPITVKQQVSNSPKATFQKQRSTFKTCTTNLLEKSLLEPIKVNFNSKDSYTVTFEIFHESSSKSELVTLPNISSESQLKELYRGLKLGNHVISISKIVDKDGCINENFDEANNYISISITDTPKINQIDPATNYCVGDHIGYQLTGTSPFTIEYSFNDLRLKSVEHTSQFIRLASDPGLISIESVQDSSSNCVVDFTKAENKESRDKLTIQIHQIPSVEVSQGDTIIQDIHEGDQAEIIFSFEGTPPFSLTYVRTEEVEVKRGKKKSQVVETHTVNEIYAYEYRVLTSLQGTYEAIEVSDAYCVARNE
ncbi:hypothetical protein WICPIJ_000495 [Wickerhamomyces pijperi]|uniref:Nucleoporin POM152 n=1 Tax=Wickerhamomyces pijperi TaxID=599730 RepID=A0A9P8TRU7_WICPI|nr:hypothetical protein WICPIJ_000495 [Wickerhamomyces pijperi]